MRNLKGEEISNEFDNKKRKLKFWQILLIVIIGFAFIDVFFDGSNGEISQRENEKGSKNAKLKEDIIPTCDGINTIENCELNGKQYTLYKYYLAVEEKSHTETVTKYKKEITGYCTLCNDGTYSPTCATGRGACSHHGGVARWNAPIYSQVPYYEEIKVIDAPAVAERYEIIEKD
jgi:hypothetical protein